MDDEHLERTARNEAAFRDVNEHLRAGKTVADAEKVFPFTCECGWLGCNRILEVTLPEYEAVRADPRHFLILDGHTIAEAEVVVARHERYTVVEKTEAEGRIAEETDPRSDEIA